tara:strand:+ start:590 stop:817 length:228 start_codon:yes stop_codon:yes gene_type:complete
MKFTDKNYLEKSSEKILNYLLKNFRLFEKLTTSKLEFNLKKIIYYFSIFGVLFILGFQLYFISQSKKINQLSKIN